MNPFASPSQKSMQLASALMTKVAMTVFLITIVGMTLTNAGAQTLLVSVDTGTTNIGSYNATTGAVINASFITGVQAPYQITADSTQIYAAELGANQVGVFNYSGSSVNTVGMTGAIGVAVSGTNLYAASLSGGRVSRFNALTGAVIDANFITGFSGLRNLLTDDSGNLYVADSSLDKVTKYDSTGTLVGGFTTINLDGAFGLALDGNNLFVTDFNKTGSVLKYNATSGALLDASFVTGLSGGAGMEIYNNTLYVADYTAKKIKTYNATTGAVLDLSFITSANNVLDAVIVVPEPSTLTLAFLGAAGLLFLGKRRCVRARVS